MTPVWRYELKFTFGNRWLAQARTWVRLHPAGLVVAYPPRRVNSLYFDTSWLSSLNSNLAGVTIRHKLRWRWYGNDLTHIQPHLEVKHKQDMLGFKEQFDLPVAVDMTRPWAAILSDLRSSVPLRWALLLRTMSQPTLLNHYWREYYVTPDNAIRVTVDYAQAAYDQRYGLRPNLRALLPLDDLVVIEVKAAQDQLDRIRKIASQFPVLRSRNSKYANGMLAALTAT
ncbi:MAG: polyphosphate polymerase domain-containing protein [Chloroflexota bacterium]|nr:polyphosphate polymerase domain-containing protein [Chloroflexota bacterium]